MNTRKIVLLVIGYVLSLNTIMAQSDSLVSGIDTVIVEGQFVTYVEDTWETSKDGVVTIAIDKMSGFVFLVQDRAESCNKIKLDYLTGMENLQNSIFLVRGTFDFFDFSHHFFDGKLDAFRLEGPWFPDRDNYTIKDSSFLYNCYYVRAKCLRAYVREDQVSLFLHYYREYVFNVRPIPVYIIQELTVIE